MLELKQGCHWYPTLTRRKENVKIQQLLCNAAKGTYRWIFITELISFMNQLIWLLFVSDCHNIVINIQIVVKQIIEHRIGLTINSRPYFLVWGSISSFKLLVHSSLLLRLFLSLHLVFSASLRPSKTSISVGFFQVFSLHRVSWKHHISLCLINFDKGILWGLSRLVQRLYFEVDCLI